METRNAKFQIGQVVRHRRYPFRGVIFDVDPTFSNSEEWWLSIPEEVRPRKDQPFYHLFAENSETTYIAYVSEQNLLVDETGIVLDAKVVEPVGDGFDEAALLAVQTYRFAPALDASGAATSAVITYALRFELAAVPPRSIEGVVREAGVRDPLEGIEPAEHRPPHVHVILGPQEADQVEEVGRRKVAGLGRCPGIGDDRATFRRRQTADVRSDPRRQVGCVLGVLNKGHRRFP